MVKSDHVGKLISKKISGDSDKGGNKMLNINPDDAKRIVGSKPLAKYMLVERNSLKPVQHLKKFINNPILYKSIWYLVNPDRVGKFECTVSANLCYLDDDDDNKREAHFFVIPKKYLDSINWHYMMALNPEKTQSVVISALTDQFQKTGLDSVDPDTVVLKNTGRTIMAYDPRLIEDRMQKRINAKALTQKKREMANHQNKKSADNGVGGGDAAATKRKKSHQSRYEKRLDAYHSKKSIITLNGITRGEKTAYFSACLKSVGMISPAAQGILIADLYLQPGDDDIISEDDIAKKVRKQFNLKLTDKFSKYAKFNVFFHEFIQTPRFMLDHFRDLCIPKNLKRGKIPSSCHVIPESQNRLQNIQTPGIQLSGALEF